MQSAVRALEATVASVREQLSEIRTNIIEGCKNAITAFREGGTRALDRAASFLHIKTGLQAMKNDLVKGVNICDRSVAQVNAFANEYHSAGRALKNMARLLIGKPPIDTKKEVGKIARALTFNYRAQKSCLLAVKAAVDKAIGGMDKLEQSADGYRAGRAAAQPTLAAELAEGREKVQHRELERKAPERAPALGAEI